MSALLHEGKKINLVKHWQNDWTFALNMPNVASFCHLVQSCSVVFSNVEGCPVDFEGSQKCSVDKIKFLLFEDVEVRCSVVLPHLKIFVMSTH